MELGELEVKKLREDRYREGYAKSLKEKREDGGNVEHVGVGETVNG